MSNYDDIAFHPRSGRIINAHWIDDHFGPHAYGVQFDGDDKVYRADECGLAAAAGAVQKLRTAMQEACDFLAERKYGSPARSPGHNARVRLESTLGEWGNR